MNSYKIIYQENKQLHKMICKDISDKDKLPKNIISIKKITNKKFSYLSTKKAKNIYNLFYELNIILQSNLSILDAILILKKNNYDINTSAIIETIHTSLINGQYIYQNLKKYEKILNPLIIEFIKIGELNGNLPQAVNSITQILEQTNSNKKKMIKSFSYPIVLSISLLLAIICIFTFVIPRFETIYIQYNNALPTSTQYLLYLKSFFDNYLIVFALLLVFTTIVFRVFYKKSTTFKEKLDRFLVTKIPLISNMFLMSNSSNFFFCLSTLLKDNHQFYDSLKNSKTLISNSYIYSKISKIQKDIKDGKNIHKAFEDSELFDALTIRLIHTGEKSNSITLTLSKIDTIYKEKLNNSLQNFITVFEPTIIAIMASIILWLVLAIFTPIWDIGTILK